MASAAAVDTMPDALRQSRYHMKRCFARYAYLISVDTSFFSRLAGKIMTLFSNMVSVENLKVHWKGKKTDEAPAVAGGDGANH